MAKQSEIDTALFGDRRILSLFEHAYVDVTLILYRSRDVFLKCRNSKLSWDFLPTFITSPMWDRIPHLIH